MQNVSTIQYRMSKRPRVATDLGVYVFNSTLYKISFAKVAGLEGICSSYTSGTRLAGIF